MGNLRHPTATLDGSISGCCVWTTASHDSRYYEPALQQVALLVPLVLTNFYCPFAAAVDASAYSALAATTIQATPTNDRVIGLPASPAYPLKASANNRYLVDQNDVPFLMVGDSPAGETLVVERIDLGSPGRASSFQDWPRGTAVPITKASRLSCNKERKAAYRCLTGWRANNVCTVCRHRAAS